MAKRICACPVWGHYPASALIASCLVCPQARTSVRHFTAGVTTRGNYRSRAAVTFARVLQVAIPSRRPLKSGDGLIAAELPLMVTISDSDGVMAVRLCASKVYHVRKLGRLQIRHALYPLLLTKQTYATAMIASTIWIGVEVRRL
jgi:hypothetical protein